MGFHGGIHGGSDEERGRETLEGVGDVGNTTTTLGSNQHNKRA
jgi:hypothetical protein